MESSLSTGTEVVEFDIEQSSPLSPASFTIANMLSFAPAPTTMVELGQEFLLGTISLTNEVWLTADETEDAFASFAFTITTSSLDNAFNQEFRGNTEIVTTGDESTAETRADLLRISDMSDVVLGGLGSLVSEGNVSRRTW